MMPRVIQVLRYYAAETNWQDRPNEHNQPRVECEIDRGQHAREILALKDRLNAMLAQHTGQDFERIARDTDRDNFMSAEAAREYGLIDAVYTKRPGAPV